MAPRGHSRRRRNSGQSSIFLRIRGLLRAFSSGSSGKQERFIAPDRRHIDPRSYERPARPVHQKSSVRIRISVWRLGIGVVLSIVLVWTGWQIFAETAARNIAASAPAEALSWMPTATALNVLAESELRKTDGDLDAARAWAREAIELSPLDDRALFLLGVIAQRKGETESAAALIQSAGARSARNLRAQLWLFEHNVRRSDFLAAILNADAMFRVQPNLLPSLFPALAAFTVNPSAMKDLSDFLASNPPWREGFLRSLSGRLSDKAHLDRIYEALIESRNPPTERELASYITRLIKDERFSLAYEKWKQATPTLNLDRDNLAYNGKFELPFDGFPFNWTADPVPGAAVQIVGIEEGKGRALRVQFSGARVQFNVRQMTLMAPGQYRLSVRVKAENLRTSRGLWWRIFCANVAKDTLAETALVSGNVPWSGQHVEFEVPSTGCEAQQLWLELPARIASERQIEGQVWYQDIRIIPLKNQ